MSQSPCEHLEKTLPQREYVPEFERRSRYAGSRVDRALPQVSDKADEKARFLKKFGEHLEPIERDVLVLRYVYDEEFGTIAKELRVVSVDTAIRIHNKALAKLKGKMSQ